MIPRAHQRGAQGFLIPALAAVGQGEGMAKLVGDAANEDRGMPAQRHVAILAVIEPRFLPGEVIQVLLGPIRRKAQAALLRRRGTEIR